MLKNTATMNHVEQKIYASELSAGDFVRIKSAESIFATLDASHALDGAVFMPEMLDFCGRTFRVFKRAHKTCVAGDTISIRGLQKLVLLSMLRCNGSSHGACDAGCLLYWHEDWLERADDPPASGETASGDEFTPNEPQDRALHVLETSCYDATSDTYRCQVTELKHITTALPAWRIDQYFIDLLHNGVKLKHFLRWAAHRLIERMKQFGNREPQDRRTPNYPIDVEPGDWVRVKAKSELEATLNHSRKNRGMWFDPEMADYSQARMQVTKEVRRIVDEKTGRMIEMTPGTFQLSGSFCSGRLHRFCTRSSLFFWRQAWLRRDESQSPDEAGPASANLQADTTHSVGPIA